MSGKKYKLLKNFTPRDLYEAQAPIELFLKCMERRSNNIDLVQVKRGKSENLLLDLEEYEPWIDWLIKNKFVEEIEEDIELKIGMILEDILTGCQHIVTNNGVYYGYNPCR